MFYLKRFIITTGKDEKSYVDFEAGLNIIHGPSNSGKSLIVDCIDFMFGGNPPKIAESPIGIKNVTLILDVDGKNLTISRNVNEKKFIVSGNVGSIENGTYKAAVGKNSIYHLWLKLMGIDEVVNIVKTQDMVPQVMGIRTFCHFFLIKENRMSSNLSILKSEEGYTNNIPIPTIMSLIYLLSGVTYTDGTKVKPSKTRSVENKAIVNFVDRSLASIGQQKIEAMNIPKDEISPEELQEKINVSKEKIKDAQAVIDALTQHSRELADEVILIDQQITESKVLKNRYKSLLSQYESDIKRLTFIAEGDLHKDLIPRLEHCPFCNGELPKEKEESCIEAASAEVKKIELQIKDLLSAGEHLDEEIGQLNAERVEKDKQRRNIQDQIRIELEPKLTELFNDLNGFRVALGRQKVAEIFENVAEAICIERDEILGENVVEPINVKEIIKKNIAEPLNAILPGLLQEAGYEDLLKVEFDVDSCDIKVNGASKASQGQGYSAYFNAILAIAIQELLKSSNHYKTNLLVIDSPILSLAEKVKHGEKVASDSMKKGLFSYLDKHTEGYQVIVVENNIPNIEYEHAHLIAFTKDLDYGRYGLVASYHVN